MDFGTAIGDVVLRTKRGDKVALIGQCVNRAVTDFCRLKKFSRDLGYLEWPVPVANSGDLIVFVPWSSFSTPVREFELVRGINDSCGLEKVDSNKTLVRGKAKPGTYYQSSTGVHVSLRAPTDIIVFSYYFMPSRLVEGTDTNWVLQTVYNEVVERASAHLFKTVGEDREADRIFQLSVVEYERAVRDLT